MRRNADLNQRQLRPVLGGQATMTEVSRLRARRAMLEAKFMAHPSQGTALALATVLQQQSVAIMKVVGVDIECELDQVLAGDDPATIADPWVEAPPLLRVWEAGANG